MIRQADPRATTVDGQPRGASEAQSAHPKVLAAYREVIARWARLQRELRIIEVERARGVEAR